MLKGRCLITQRNTIQNAGTQPKTGSRSQRLELSGGNRGSRKAACAREEASEILGCLDRCVCFAGIQCSIFHMEWFFGDLEHMPIWLIILAIISGLAAWRIAVRHFAIKHAKFEAELEKARVIWKKVDAGERIF